MSFSIREPEHADARLIAELHVATWRETYVHLLPEGFFDDAHLQARNAMWDRILQEQRPEWTIRVAESGNELIGFAMCGPSFGIDGQDLPRVTQLYSIYVKQARHGRGVGQALLTDVLGDSAAMLWVAKENPRAIAFYERNGFTRDGVEQIDPGAPKITDVRMIR